MLNQQTLDKMNAMKLAGMVDALKLQLGAAEHARLSFDERLGLLVDAEWTTREQRKLTKRLRLAKLRYPASFEDIDVSERPNPATEEQLKPRHFR
jgi:hypothetical protein